MFSVVIPTIGRSTLDNAILSVLKESATCIVVNDGIDMESPNPHDDLKYIKLGRNFGRLDGLLWYGQIAFTAGVYISESEFTMAIGDDDELLPGSGEIIRAKINANPDIDMWIPGIAYNNGHVACMSRNHLACGNISHTIYRSKIFAFEPMYHHHYEDAAVQDWIHVQRCVKSGWKIDWIESPCVAIRPKLSGTNGRGQVN